MAIPPSPGQSFKGYIDTKGFARFHLQFKSYELPLYDVAVVVSSFSPFVIKDYQVFSKQQQQQNKQYRTGQSRIVQGSPSKGRL